MMKTFFSAVDGEVGTLKGEMVVVGSGRVCTILTLCLRHASCLMHSNKCVISAFFFFFSFYLSFYVDWAEQPERVCIKGGEKNSATIFFSFFAIFGRFSSRQMLMYHEWRISVSVSLWLWKSRSGHLSVFQSVSVCLYPFLFLTF